MSYLAASETYFTHVVPLGLSCRVTHQARTYFRAVAAYPFDWWISSLDGIVRYLDNPDPDRIFRMSGLMEKMEDGWIHSIVSREFGFQLFHEFPRQKETPAVRVVSPNWRDAIKPARIKHQIRLERMLALDRPENSILFVRHKLDAADHVTNFQTMVDRLWQILHHRWQQANIKLLFVNVPHFTPPSPDVLSLALDDRPGPANEAWRGDDVPWATAFRSIGLLPNTMSTLLVQAPSPGELI